MELDSSSHLVLPAPVVARTHQPGVRNSPSRHLCRSAVPCRSECRHSPKRLPEPDAGSALPPEKGELRPSLPGTVWEETWPTAVGVQPLDPPHPHCPAWVVLRPSGEDYAPPPQVHSAQWGGVPHQPSPQESRGVNQNDQTVSRVGDRQLGSSLSTFHPSTYLKEGGEVSRNSGSPTKTHGGQPRHPANARNVGESIVSPEVSVPKGERGKLGPFSGQGRYQSRYPLPR